MRRGASERTHCANCSVAIRALRTAARKRPISTRQLEEIVDATENLLHQREDREISTTDIGAFVMDRLKTLDQVAYVRFASVYRRFDDIEAFQQVLKNLINNPARLPEG